MTDDGKYNGVSVMVWNEKMILTQVTNWIILEHTAQRYFFEQASALR